MEIIKSEVKTIKVMDRVEKTALLYAYNFTSLHFIFYAIDDPNDSRFYILVGGFPRINEDKDYPKVQKRNCIVLNERIS